jgi:hypothetical protein
MRLEGASCGVDRRQPARPVLHVGSTFAACDAPFGAAREAAGQGRIRAHRTESMRSGSCFYIKICRSSQNRGLSARPVRVDKRRVSQDDFHFRIFAPRAAAIRPHGQPAPSPDHRSYGAHLAAPVIRARRNPSVVSLSHHRGALHGDLAAYAAGMQRDLASPGGRRSAPFTLSSPCQTTAAGLVSRARQTIHRDSRSRRERKANIRPNHLPSEA